jgi:hypothetical protein
MGRIQGKYLVQGSLLFALLALPVFLFVFINVFKLNTIQFLHVTMPRLPVEARYESLAAVFKQGPLQEVLENVVIMGRLFWTQEDDFTWNFVHPYGYFYKLTFPLIFAGFVFLVISLMERNGKYIFGRWLLFFWVISSVLIGVIHPVNLTRINLIFTPFLLCLVMLFVQMGRSARYVTVPVVLSLLIGFIFFIRAYFGLEYRTRASEAFNFGIIPAIQYATESRPQALVCVTEQTKFAYIYTLFVKRIPPSEYLDKMEWILPPQHPLDPSRSPRILGPFRFKLSDCIGDPNAVYILKLKESVPNTIMNFKSKKFGKYEVYLPKTTE